MSVSKTELWFFDWLKEHQYCHPSRTWVAHDDDGAMRFYAGWIEAFEDNRITRDEAYAATRELQRKDPGYPAKHLKAILLAVAEARSKSGKGAGLSSRERAELESRDCKRCKGEGLTTVWQMHPDHEHKEPATVAAYCECAMGRWTEQRHREKSPDVHLRTPSVRAIKAAPGGKWRLEPPSAAEWMSEEQHQAWCEAAWSKLDEPARDEWRKAAVARFPFLSGRRGMNETMAMCMAAGEFNYPPPADFRTKAESLAARLVAGPKPSPELTLADRILRREAEAREARRAWDEKQAQAQAANPSPPPSPSPSQEGPRP